MQNSRLRVHVRWFLTWVSRYFVHSVSTWVLEVRYSCYYNTLTIIKVCLSDWKMGLNYCWLVRFPVSSHSHISPCKQLQLQAEKVQYVVQVEMHSTCSIMVFPGGAYMCIPPVCTLVPLYRPHETRQSIWILHLKIIDPTLRKQEENRLTTGTDIHT